MIQEELKVGDTVVPRRGRGGPWVIKSIGAQGVLGGGEVEVAFLESGGFVPLGNLKSTGRQPKLGDLIQHVSGTGPVFEIIKVRRDYDDMLAVTLDTDPELKRVVNPENWKVVKI